MAFEIPPNDWLTLPSGPGPATSSLASALYVVGPRPHGPSMTEHVEVYFDGACPLCMREITMLRRLDRARRIRFTDIAAPGFDPSRTGLTMDALMARIHGRRLPSGEPIEGVEVFRALYEAVGAGPLVALTRLPGVRQLLDAGYRAFAANRLRLTGRCAPGAEACEVPRSA